MGMSTPLPRADGPGAVLPAGAVRGPGCARRRTATGRPGCFRVADARVAAVRGWTTWCADRRPVPAGDGVGCRVAHDHAPRFVRHQRGPPGTGPRRRSGWTSPPSPGPCPVRAPVRVGGPFRAASGASRSCGIAGPVRDACRRDARRAVRQGAGDRCHPPHGSSWSMAWPRAAPHGAKPCPRPPVQPVPSGCRSLKGAQGSEAAATATGSGSSAVSSRDVQPADRRHEQGDDDGQPGRQVGSPRWKEPAGPLLGGRRAVRVITGRSRRPDVGNHSPGGTRRRRPSCRWLTGGGGRHTCHAARRGAAGQVPSPGLGQGLLSMRRRVHLAVGLRRRRSRPG